MQHVSYLAIADGLLTMDKKLVEPLAKATFPGKDLFSNISEITKDYRFDNY